MDDIIENILKNNFQRTMEFEISNKVFKRGKFILYRLETYDNNYEITLMLQKNNKIENFKLPYPFKIEYYHKESQIFFDYRLHTLCNGDKVLLDNIQKVCKNYNSNSRFLDKILKINLS